MCILALLLRHASRFPLVLVSNRDELVARATAPVRIDEKTGILWAMDEVGGGSWLGVNVKNGRFATITNCRSGPSSPRVKHKAGISMALPAQGGGKGAPGSTEAPSACGGGAMLRDADGAPVAVTPKAEVLRRLRFGSPRRLDAPTLARLCQTQPVVLPPGVTQVCSWPDEGAASFEATRASHFPATALLQNDGIPASVKSGEYFVYPVEFVGDASRGLLVRDFLVDGTVPNPALPPYLEGYNLVTCDSLFNLGIAPVAGNSVGDSPMVASHRHGLRYTSNRFGMEYLEDISDNQIHCLGNGYLDRWHEPKSLHLSKQLESIIGTYLDNEYPEEPTHSRKAFDQDKAAERLAACLCEQPNFNPLHDFLVATEGAGEALRNLHRGEASHRESPGEQQQLPSGNDEVRLLYQLLSSAEPLHGLTYEELYGALAASPAAEEASSGCVPVFVSSLGWSWERENFLNQNVFTASANFSTSVQTVLVVERLPSTTSPSITSSTAACADGPLVIHFSQRTVRSPSDHDEWQHFTIAAGDYS